MDSRLRSSRTYGTRQPTVLFINQAYPPAHGGARLRDMAVNLVQRGWRVTVLTGPAGGDAAFLPGGVRVVRVRGFPSRHRFLFQHVIAVVLLYPALFLRALLLGRFDVVVSKGGSPLLPVLGNVLGSVFGSKTVHWEQELYPEVSEALDGLRPGGWIAGLLRSFSSTALRRKDLVIAVGRCMKDRLASRGVDRIAVVPNWPMRSLQPIEHRVNTFRRDHGLHGKFVVMVSGDLERACALGALLEAAREMRGTYDDIRFVLAGPQHARVAAQIDGEGLDNVHLIPSSGELSNRLSAGDLHVVTMDEDVCGVLVPSGLYDALAVGRPCLFLGPEKSEAALFLREQGAGEVLAEADGPAVALHILRWYQRDVRRRKAGSLARRAVRLLRANALIEFDELLRGLFREPATEPIPIAGRAPTEPEALAA